MSAYRIALLRNLNNETVHMRFERVKFHEDVVDAAKTRTKKRKAVPEMQGLATIRKQLHKLLGVASDLESPSLGSIIRYGLYRTYVISTLLTLLEPNSRP